MFPPFDGASGGSNPWAWTQGQSSGTADWAAAAAAGAKDKDASASPNPPTATSPPSAGSPSGAAQAQNTLFQWLLAQVGVLIDTQIKRARQDAEHNFRVEMTKMRKELQGVHVFADQQGKVISTLSKDLGAVAQELQRVQASLHALQTQILQQRQVASTVQLALDRGIKQLADIDKRLLSAGGPPSSGMLRAFAGAGMGSGEMEQALQHAAVDQAMLMSGAQPGRNRTRKKKEGGKSLRAEAPEFVPGGGAPAAEAADAPEEPREAS